MRKDTSSRLLLGRFYELYLSKNEYVKVFGYDSDNHNVCVYSGLLGNIPECLFTCEVNIVYPLPNSFLGLSLNYVVKE